MPKRLLKLTNALVRIERDVTTILTKYQSSRYLEGMVVMYSVIENVLKWTVFVKLIWDRCDRNIPWGERERLRAFCNQQDFYSALNLALASGLIGYGLFRRLDKIRSERNDVLHQCYVFPHRRNRKVLRVRIGQLVGQESLWRVHDARTWNV